MKHPDNNKKNGKKNTLLRKLKAFELRLDRRQRERRIDPVDDETVRVCANCGKEFEGRFCPQCGQDATWNAFSWKQENRNVLDFLGLCKDTLSKSIKKTLKQKPAKVKPVKKNTLKRKFKAWLTRLDRSQQELASIPVHDTTARVCSNCGEEYMGRYCPQCGQAGTWHRYTWRQIILNFLDIWGLGNRPIFRTVKDLFWRPGYMVHDYLNGNRQYYFPPFKLLAVSMILLLFAYFLTGQKYESELGELVKSFPFENLTISPFFEKMIHGLVAGLNYLSSNPLYETLFFIVLGVCCVRAAFANKGKYNFVETFIFLVFLVSQQTICSIFKILFSGPFNYLDTYLLTSQAFSSAPVQALYGMLTVALSFVSKVFLLFTILLVVIGFKQFYDIKWKTAVGGLIRSVAFGFLSLCVMIAIASVFYKKGFQWGAYMLLLMGLIAVVAFVVLRYLRNNESQLNRFSYKSSRVLLWFSLISVPFLSVIIYSSFMSGGVWYLSLVAVLLAAIAMFISLSPAFLYKKYQRTWLCLLPFALIIIVFILLLGFDFRFEF